MFCFMYIGILAILFSFKKKTKQNTSSLKKEKSKLKSIFLHF